MRRIIPAGDLAMLIELDDLDEALRMHSALLEAKLAGVYEIMPAARTVLIEYDDPKLSKDLVNQIRNLDLGQSEHYDSLPVIVPTIYDGQDLAEVAELLGISIAELIERHSSAIWRVAFVGFAPGFAYQVCDDPIFNVPRRSSPRTRIPAGSVGLAGNFSGVYPRESPGGWQLLGRTPLNMFDITRDPAVLLQPGMRVKYQQIDPAEAVFQNPGELAPIAAENFGLRVIDAGLQTLVQDDGRAGSAGFGVSPSGSFDKTSAHAANRAVGNDENAAVLEILMTGASFEACGGLLVGVGGADAEIQIRRTSGVVDSLKVDRQKFLHDGDQIIIGPALRGIRSYLAVAGGISAPQAFNSSATDLLSGVGPARVKTGELLAVADLPRQVVPDVTFAHTAIRPLPKMPGDQLVILDIVLGPRTDWFSQRGLETLLTQEWLVKQESNRVGIRLAGEIPLERAIMHELPSEGAIVGAIQVPSDGQPVIFGPDHPLTGGYPIIGSLVTNQIDILGQLAPGTRLKFRAINQFHEL